MFKAFICGFLEMINRFYSPVQLLDYIASMGCHLIILTILVVQGAPTLVFCFFGGIVLNIMLSYIFKKYQYNKNFIIFQLIFYLLLCILGIIAAY